MKIDKRNWPTWSPSSVLHITTSEEIEPNLADTGKSATTKLGIQLIIDINRHSKLMKLHRVTAYVLRFAHNTKHPSQKTADPLTATELHDTQNVMDQDCPTRSIWERIYRPQIKDNHSTPVSPSAMSPFE